MVDVVGPGSELFHCYSPNGDVARFVFNNGSSFADAMFSSSSSSSARGGSNSTCINSKDGTGNHPRQSDWEKQTASPTTGRPSSSASDGHSFQTSQSDHPPLPVNTLFSSHSPYPIQSNPSIHSSHSTSDHPPLQPLSIENPHMECSSLELSPSQGSLSPETAHLVPLMPPPSQHNLYPFQ